MTSIRKKVKYIALFIFLFLLIMIKVSTAETITLSEQNYQNNKAQNYDLEKGIYKIGNNIEEGIYNIYAPNDIIINNVAYKAGETYNNLILNKNEVLEIDNDLTLRKSENIFWNKTLENGQYLSNKDDTYHFYLEDISENSSVEIIVNNDQVYELESNNPQEDIALKENDLINIYIYQNTNLKVNET